MFVGARFQISMIGEDPKSVAKGISTIQFEASEVTKFCIYLLNNVPCGHNYINVPPPEVPNSRHANLRHLSLRFCDTLFQSSRPVTSAEAIVGF